MFRLDRISIGDILTLIIAALGIGAAYYNVVGKHDALAEKVKTDEGYVKEIKEDTNERLGRIENKLDRLIEGQIKR